VIGALAYFGVGTLVFAVAWVLYRNHAAELERRRLVRRLTAEADRRYTYPHSHD
jgi:hypothetical protein